MLAPPPRDHTETLDFLMARVCVCVFGSLILGVPKQDVQAGTQKPKTLMENEKLKKTKRPWKTKKLGKPKNLKENNQKAE